MNKPHDFRERLAFSEGIEMHVTLMQRIADMVPNATAVNRASEQEDRHGTDYWIERTHGLPALSIDVKHRGFCPIERWNSDDACIETTSVYLGPLNAAFTDEHRRKPGWTVDYRKRTDFVVYTWPHEDGQRFWIVPFVPLCRAARENWRLWARQYRERPALNNGYNTLSVYPPRGVIFQAMQRHLSGVA